MYHARYATINKPPLHSVTCRRDLTNISKKKIHKRLYTYFHPEKGSRDLHNKKTDNFTKSSLHSCTTINHVLISATEMIILC